jgi:hypothetical protein
MHPLKISSYPHILTLHAPLAQYAAAPPPPRTTSSPVTALMPCLSPSVQLCPMPHWLANHLAVTAHASGRLTASQPVSSRPRSRIAPRQRRVSPLCSCAHPSRSSSPHRLHPSPPTGDGEGSSTIDHCAFLNWELMEHFFKRKAPEPASTNRARNSCLDDINWAKEIK